MAEDPKENVAGEKPGSPATYEASGLIDLVKEREQEAIKAKEERFLPATMNSLHAIILEGSTAWMIGPGDSSKKQVSIPDQTRILTYSIEILSMTRFTEVMYDWKLGSSSNFLVTTQWHVSSCQLSKRTGLISNAY